MSDWRKTFNKLAVRPDEKWPYSEAYKIAKEIAALFGKPNTFIDSSTESYRVKLNYIKWKPSKYGFSEPCTSVTKQEAEEAVSKAQQKLDENGYHEATARMGRGNAIIGPITNDAKLYVDVPYTMTHKKTKTSWMISDIDPELEDEFFKKPGSGKGAYNYSGYLSWPNGGDERIDVKADSLEEAKVKVLRMADAFYEPGYTLDGVEQIHGIVF